MQIEVHKFLLLFFLPIKFYLVVDFPTNQICPLQNIFYQSDLSINFFDIPLWDSHSFRPEWPLRRTFCPWTCTRSTRPLSLASPAAISDGPCTPPLVWSEMSSKTHQFHSFLVFLCFLSGVCILCPIISWPMQARNSSKGRNLKPKSIEFLRLLQISSISPGKCDWGRKIVKLLQLLEW